MQTLLEDAENCRRCAPTGLPDKLRRVLFRIPGVNTVADIIASKLRGDFWEEDYDFLLKNKVLVLGDREARKTKLLQPYVNAFDGRYAESMGVSVAIRRDLFPLPEQRVTWRLVMSLFDILGERWVPPTLFEGYSHGARGVIAVCDVSIPSTVGSLGRWIDSAYAVVGQVPTVVLATQTDRGNAAKATTEDARALAASYDAHFIGPTLRRKASVNLAFRVVGEDLVRRTFGTRPFGSLPRG